MPGPAKAVRIRFQGAAGGQGSWDVPSKASLVIICGRRTNPPAGIHRMEYSMPLRFQLLIL